MTDQQAAQTDTGAAIPAAVMKRLQAAIDEPYTGGIWEAGKFREKPYAHPVRREDLERVLAALRATTPATTGAREEPTSEQIKQLAIKLCDIDEFGPLSSHPPGTGDFNPRWAEFALGYDKPDDPHSGDCTKQPWTCTRCLRAEYEQKALAALRIAAPPAQPAGGEHDE